MSSRQIAAESFLICCFTSKTPNPISNCLGGFAFVAFLTHGDLLREITFLRLDTRTGYTCLICRLISELDLAFFAANLTLVSLSLRVNVVLQVNQNPLTV